MAAPSIETMIRQGPMALAVMACPILGFALSSLMEGVTEEEKEEQKKEAKRRTGILEDMIQNLQQSEEEDDKQEGDDQADKTQEEDVKQEGDDQVDDDEDVEGDEYDDVGQLEFDTLRERCAELAEVEPGAPVLEAGVEWCGKLLLKELQRATTKTQAQNDVRYSDGKKLAGLLDSPLILDQLSRTAKFKVPTALRSEISDAYRRGNHVHRSQKWNDILKAIKIVFIAWETLPWVFASNAMSTVATTISTMALHYRAEVLQALKDSASRAPFYRATRATIIVELLAGMSRTLEAQLSARVDRIMAKSLQVKLFNALLSKDVVWWGEQKSAFEYKYAWMVLDLPSEIKNALAVPRRLINTLTSVSIQAALVRAKSSQMLRVIVGLHWTDFFMRKGLGYLQDLCNRRAAAGLVVSAQSEMTWAEALNPQYVQMFQSFCRGPLEAKNLIKYTRAENRLGELRGAVQAGFSPVFSLLRQSRSIVEFLSMGRVMGQRGMDITDAETTLNYASNVGDNIEDTYETLGSIQEQFGELARAYDLIAIPAKFAPFDGYDPGCRSSGHFVFEDVKFAFPGKKDPVLKGVSFEVKSGQAVGITGETGCGKSTLLKLVERFYDVTGGRILLDGRDIREYQPHWLRSQIITVSQEPKLIPASIRDNLTFGCASPPSIEQIEEACRSANIWDVLKDSQKFPNGLETEMSVIQNVSGGEKQRICIARAILADPPVLLLDEATSALDEVSQACVQEALNKLMKGRTTLVIAHRLSTIKDSNKIIGMRDGKVVDDGTHEELLAKSSEEGLWRHLWEHSQSHACHSKSEHSSGKSEEAADNTEENLVEQAAPPRLPSAPPKLQRTVSLPVPTLQRSTTSMAAKYDVLRQALASLAETEDAEERRRGVRHMHQLIDNLDAQAKIDTSMLNAKPWHQAKIANSKSLTPAMSRWLKLRSLHKRGVLEEAIAGPILEREITVPSLERAITGPILESSAPSLVRRPSS